MISSDTDNYVTGKEFLERAIQFEIDSADLYRSMQSVSLDATVNELLKILEKEEVYHEKRLRKQAETVSDDSILQFPPDISLTMPVIATQQPTLQELIAYALEREKQSVKMYHSVADMVLGDFKELLEGLATFEQNHVEKLKSLQIYY